MVTGLGAGKRSGERICEALSEFYTNVEDPITSSRAMDDPDMMRRVAEGSILFLHSMAMLAAEGTKPKSIHSFNAPLSYDQYRMPKTRLLARTVCKTARMHTPGLGIESADDLKRVLAYDASSAAELGAHLWGNLKHLGRIARFDAVEQAAAAVASGIHTELTYTSDDSYFSPTDEHYAHARRTGVAIHMFDGQHDELVLRPQEMLAQYLNRVN